MKPLQRLAINLANAAALGCLVVAMAACSGQATKPPPYSPPASTYKPSPSPKKTLANESGQLPVGSAAIVRSDGSKFVFAASSVAALDRLLTFAKAGDDAGAHELVDAGYAALLTDGTKAKVISHPNYGTTEIRVRTGPQNGKLWIIPSERLSMDH